MIDPYDIPTVIDEHIDPRLNALLKSVPANVRVIFAGKDAPFLDALRRIYGNPLRCPDVLISAIPGHFLVTVGMSDESDGLYLRITPSEDNSYFVQPALISTLHRAPGLRARLREDPESADLVIAAFEDFIFRRVLPAERVS